MNPPIVLVAQGDSCRKTAGQNVVPVTWNIVTCTAVAIEGGDGRTKALLHADIKTSLAAIRAEARWVAENGRGLGKTTLAYSHEQRRPEVLELLRDEFVKLNAEFGGCLEEKREVEGLAWPHDVIPMNSKTIQDSLVSYQQGFQTATANYRTGLNLLDCVFLPLSEMQRVYEHIVQTGGEITTKKLPLGNLKNNIAMAQTRELFIVHDEHGIHHLRNPEKTTELYMGLYSKLARNPIFQQASNRDKLAMLKERIWPLFDRSNLPDSRTEIYFAEPGKSFEQVKKGIFEDIISDQTLLWLEECYKYGKATEIAAKNGRFDPVKFAQVKQDLDRGAREGRI